jgi:hypothetical protein
MGVALSVNPPYSDWDPVIDFEDEADFGGSLYQAIDSEK